MKKETRLKLMLSLLIGTIFVIGAARCNNDSTTSISGSMSRDGAEIQIDNSESEFHQLYLEEKEVN